MFSKFNFTAAGFGALLMAFAFAGVTQVVAQAAPDAGAGTYSTTCAAGTLDKCGDVPIVHCDWMIDFGVNPESKSLELKVGKTNCKVTGSMPVYKDKENSSLKSGSCDLLAPFLGMPAGTSCSEE